MNKTLEWLKGKKTYITTVIGAIVVVLWWLNIIDSDLADKILILLGFGGIAALRASKK